MKSVKIKIARLPHSALNAEEVGHVQADNATEHADREIGQAE